MSHKKLKKDHEYKYFVSAYKMVEGRKIYIARFNDVHVALKQASTTNAASIAFCHSFSFVQSEPDGNYLISWKKLPVKMQPQSRRQQERSGFPY